eukprot:Gb_21250 [translate_table: standard]
MKRAKECCMCGDSGFSHELFQCMTCLYRSQHTYCSILYPKADTYQICDWCLRNGEHCKAASKEATESKCFEKSTAFPLDQTNSDCYRSCPSQHVAIKKQKSMLSTAEKSTVRDEAVLHSTKKIDQSVSRSQTFCAKGQKFVQERIRKPRDEPGNNRSINCVRSAISCKDVFMTKSQMPSSKPSTPRLVRGKVRRYKLLEEVSS